MHAEEPAAPAVETPAPAVETPVPVATSNLWSLKYKRTRIQRTEAN